MVKKILAGIGVIFVLFFIFVATRPAHFSYNRSGVLKAPPEKIYPYLSDFKLGNQWSPFMQKDPNVKVTYTGTEKEVGAGMTFAGNNDVGEGRLEILSLTPPTKVEMRLEMLKPFHGLNRIEYLLAPEGDATRFTWTMDGEANFMGKLMGVFIDCDKMIGGEFEKGIQNLKTIVEK